jgi:predicted transcriptional regulator
MTQTIEQDHAESNADGWAQSIIEMIDTKTAAMADDGSELDAQDRIERAEQAIHELLEALKNANQRIKELCDMVCHLSGNPKKVRAEDYADKVRTAIAKVEGN